MDFILNAKSREDVGKGASRRLRHEGLVPAVIYGGEDPAKSITLTQSELAKVMKSRAFYSTIISLHTDGGEAEEVIVKDIQRHPFKELIQHMDFVRITRGQTMKFTVPLRFINEDTCKGVKSGGELYRLVTEVEIECRPSKLPEFIAVDMLEVDLNEAVHLNDLKLEEGLELVAFQQGFDEEHNVVVANIREAFDNAVEDDAPEAPDAPDASAQSADEGDA